MTCHQSPSASEKIVPFSGRLLFSLHFCYFSGILFGGIRIFCIFASEQGVAVMYASDGEKNNRKNGFYV